MEPSGWVVRPLHVDVDVEPQEGNLTPSDFSTFYRVTWVEIYRPLVVTIRDSDLAADALDEAMERAYARWSRVSGMSNPEGWIYRSKQVGRGCRPATFRPTVVELLVRWPRQSSGAPRS